MYSIRSPSEEAAQESTAKLRRMKLCGCADFALNRLMLFFFFFFFFFLLLLLLLLFFNYRINDFTTKPTLLHLYQAVPLESLRRNGKSVKEY